MLRQFIFTIASLGLIYPSTSLGNEIIMQCVHQQDKHIAYHESVWKYEEAIGISKTIQLRHKGKWSTNWCDDKEDCSIGDRGGNRTYLIGTNDIIEETIDFILQIRKVKIWKGKTEKTGTPDADIVDRCRILQ